MQKLVLLYSLLEVGTAAVRALLGLGSVQIGFSCNFLCLGGGTSVVGRLVENFLEFRPAHLALELQFRRKEIRRTQLDKTIPNTGAQLALDIRFDHHFHGLFPEIDVLDRLIQRHVEDFVLHATPGILELLGDQLPRARLQEVASDARTEVVHA